MEVVKRELLAEIHIKQPQQW